MKGITCTQKRFALFHHSPDWWVRYGWIAHPSMRMAATWHPWTEQPFRDVTTCPAPRWTHTSTRHNRRFQIRPE